MDPIFAITALTWVTSNAAQGAPLAWCLGSILAGILGNEAHRLYREQPSRITKALAPLTTPENHDLARAVRTAQIEALERLGMDYRDAHRAGWDAAPGTRPTAFLHHVDGVCRDARSRLADAAFDQSVTDNLRGAFEGLLSDAEVGGAAAERTRLMAELAEDAVFEELRATPGAIQLPRDFAAHFRNGMGDRPRFLDLFGAFFSEQIKPDTPARAIFTAKLLTRIEGLAYDSTEIVRRIELQFGALLADLKRDTQAIRRGQEVERARAAERHAEVTDGQRRLERLVIDAAGSGAVSVQAIADIRDLLRPSIDEIDAYPAERLPGLVQRILEEVRKPTAIDEGFSGAVKRALTEAQARIGELAFADAAHVLDAQLAQIESEDRDRARGRAALLAERGRVASLQLRYRDAASFHARAAGAVAFEPATAWGHAQAAASALYDQGEEFGDNAALVSAIEAYVDNVLPLASRRDRPLDWATTQNNLGTALSRLGGREAGTARLEEAVTAYRDALKECTRERVPLDWAMTQNNLGNALSRLGGREAGTARLEEAVTAYRDALKERTRERVPLDWAATQNNLGTALSTLGGREAGTARLEEAVTAYRDALKECTRERVPLDWATTQNNLGTALSTLGEREAGTARLEEAVTAYRDALKERTRERVPLDWAATQNNFGTALSTLGGREAGTARLEEAVTAYRDALKECTRERVPLDWAMTQNNLGNTLSRLGGREAGTARLEEAVTAYRDALKERTRERVPLDWATTQNNLGNALLMLGGREAGTARLEEAVTAYRDALKERTRERVPLGWAMTQNNLGTALSRLGGREAGTARLEEAVTAYRDALKERTRERVPLDWAMTQNNLGTALSTLGEREAGTARLEEAVTAYRDALKECTRERVPLDWAMTQNNLGLALSTLGEREAGTARLEAAATAYRDALAVFVSASAAHYAQACRANRDRVLTLLAHKQV